VFLKVKRVVAPEVIENCRRGRCEICGAPAHGRPHHIITVGAGGPDIKENLIQLCWRCHYQDLPAGKLSRGRLFKQVARRLGITLDEVVARVEQAMGRGIKGL